MDQYDLFPGEQLRDEGMQRAIDHADAVNDKWSEKAYTFLLKWLRYQDAEFMTEDVRKASTGLIPDAPHDRAWGGIIRKAAMAGLIMKVGYRSVTNPQAHCANASVWQKISKKV